MARKNATTDAPIVLDVVGDFACFTRPDAKAERISYPMITPSAARGVLEAVFWKPEFSYRIRKIELLRPISWFRIRRNEVSSAPALSTIRKLGDGFRFDAAADRDQRFTLGLRDVAYRIHADIELKPHTTDTVAKYVAQAQRRIDRGACFAQPYLGSREFSASDFGPPASGVERVSHDEYLGIMLLDVDHSVSPARSTWFTAWLRDGVLDVPPEGIHDPARDEQGRGERCS
ncbi:CRISPR-associated Cas5d family protein [Lentzea atacamensis]|uniref:pre-crRNA processing endonuclease n=1 Tax=Lentzea atacamensis TaxID=531938 RepID=A0ABX9DWR6_9PSEU|nr:type I-C CRISPR-associated protein Cas5c [Lentzea atacamensis]RAS59732.1 CRISPR-associated Cas5d family protein [Lentzea atacamensis]